MQNGTEYADMFAGGVPRFLVFAHGPQPAGGWLDLVSKHYTLEEAAAVLLADTTHSFGHIVDLQTMMKVF